MPVGVYERVKGKKYGSTGCHWKLSKKTKNKISLGHKGEKNYLWKGSEVSYFPLHQWVSRWKKNPGKCQHCNEVKNMMGWANIDHKYRRVLDDYIYLCPKCHGAYDALNNLRKHTNTPKKWRKIKN